MSDKIVHQDRTICQKKIVNETLNFTEIFFHLERTFPCAYCNSPVYKVTLDLVFAPTRSFIVHHNSWEVLHPITCKTISTVIALCNHPNYSCWLWPCPHMLVLVSSLLLQRDTWQDKVWYQKCAHQTYSFWLQEEPWNTVKGSLFYPTWQNTFGWGLG